jgi:hypothetical protein
MPRMKIGAIKFGKVYPLYVQKVEKKGRTRAELDEVICWLTGYDQAGLDRMIGSDCDFEEFFDAAPALNPKASLITGMICGYRIEDIADPLEQKVRYLDKLVDELAKSRKMEKILRT